MAMILSPTYRNLSAGQNTDRAGKIVLDLVAALVGTTLWRRKHQGDGLAAYSSGTASLFTAHGGTGYATANTAGLWPTGVANSFTNILAYIMLEELDEAGVPTGRQIAFQRHTGSNSTVCNNLTVAFSWTGLTGTADADTCPATGNVAYLCGTSLNAGGTANFLGSLPGGSYEIPDALTINYSIWVPDGLSGTTEDVAPFQLVLYDGASATFGSVLLYEATLGTTGDPHPCVAAWSTWSAAYGESVTVGTYSNFAATGQGLWACNAAGTVSQASWTAFRFPSSTVSPATTVAGTKDLAGVLPMFPAMAWMDTTPGVFKGRAESGKFYVPTTNDYVFPHTAFADAPHATEPPMVLCGCMAWPWEVGLNPTHATASVDRTDMATMFLPEVPDVPDTTAPTVTRVSPVGKLSKTSAVVLDITEASLGPYFLAARFPGTTLPLEPVYFSTIPNERTPYTVTVSANGEGVIRLTIRRRVGWTHSPTFEIFAIDTSGNMSS